MDTKTEENERYLKLGQLLHQQITLISKFRTDVGELKKKYASFAVSVHTGNTKAEFRAENITSISLETKTIYVTQSTIVQKPEVIYRGRNEKDDGCFISVTLFERDPETKKKTKRGLEIEIPDIELQQVVPEAACYPLYCLRKKQFITKNPFVRPVYFKG